MLIGVTGVSRLVGDEYDNDFSLPDSQSQQMVELLEQHAPSQSGDRVTVVLHDERGWDTDADVDGLTQDLAEIGEVDSVAAPAVERATVSDDGPDVAPKLALQGRRRDGRPGSSIARVSQ